jgi:hypothetical protein
MSPQMPERKGLLERGGIGKTKSGNAFYTRTVAHGVADYRTLRLAGLCQAFSGGKSSLLGGKLTSLTLSAWRIERKLTVAVELNVKNLREPVVFGCIGFCAGVTLCFILLERPMPLSEMHGALTLSGAPPLSISPDHREFQGGEPLFDDWRPRAILPT